MSYSTSVNEPYGVVARRTGREPFANQQGQVVITPAGTWVCGWTRAREGAPDDQAAVVARSTDDGRTWGQPIVVEGPTEASLTPSSLQLFAVPHTGRLYAFYWWHAWPNPPCDPGSLYMRYSDDDGRSWSRPHPPASRRYQLPMPRHAAVDEEDQPLHGWSSGLPKIMPDGRVVFTFAKIRPSTVAPWLEARRRIEERSSDPEEAHASVWHTQAFLMVAENLLSQTDPLKIAFTVLPEGSAGVCARLPRGVVSGDELCVEALANGDWLGTFRTPAGCLYFATSSDGGRTWGSPQPLRFCHGGPAIPHPNSSLALSRLADGRFVLLLHNNAGDANGGVGPWDHSRVCTPLWVAVGRELRHRTTGQRIVWGAPKVIVDNHANFAEGPWPRRTDLSHPQFIEWAGRYFVAYTDRGRDILLNEVDPRLADDFGLPA